MQLTPTDPDLETIVRRIQRGDIDLQPDFQRGEVWTPSKKQHLVDSVLRNWHIPPIHLVVKQDGRQEVLDGQQRLVAIRDFVNGKFAVDGYLEPHDEQISTLHGFRYNELPAPVRRQFDGFTVRVYLLSDYKPEEPGELFFRLNQPAPLTTAEKRNAFLGPARDQVRRLAEYLKDEVGEVEVGFTNRRMAYDDVIAKFLYLLEVGRIDKRVTASDLSSRFRSLSPFDDRNVQVVRTSLDLLFMKPERISKPGHLNKATLLTWMLFLARLNRKDALPDFFVDLPVQRFYCDFQSLNYESREIVPSSSVAVLRYPRAEVLVDLYMNRASFRVADSSSVIIRDLVLWALFDIQYPELGVRSRLPADEQPTLEKVYAALESSEPRGGRDVEAIASSEPWGRLL